MAKAEKISYNLSAAEKSVILRMRQLQPYERIEIKLKDNKPGVVSIVSTATAREDFPVSML